jgi:hypothetical protein
VLIDDVRAPGLLALVWRNAESPAVRELVRQARRAFSEPPEQLSDSLDTPSRQGNADSMTTQHKSVQVPTRCSFCGKPHEEAAKLVAGPGVYICDTCVDLCEQIIAGSPKTDVSEAVHWGPDPDDVWVTGMSDEDVLTALPRQELTVAQAERDLVAWVRILRDRNVTWARIGEALGISRQAAWDRFAADIESR